MKKYISMLSAAFAVALIMAPAVQAELIGNGGFEMDLLDNDVESELGNFSLFLGGGIDPASNGVTTDNPLSGAQALTLTIGGADNTFVGYQQLIQVVGGEDYTYTINARTDGGVYDIQNAEYRFEWRDADNNLIFPTDNGDTTALDGTYRAFTRTETAPDNAAFANVVFALASFNPEGTNSGTVFIDDVSVTGPQVIPEPTSAGLVALTILGLVSRRRR